MKRHREFSSMEEEEDGEEIYKLRYAARETAAESKPRELCGYRGRGLGVGSG